KLFPSLLLSTSKWETCCSFAVSQFNKMSLSSIFPENKTNSSGSVVFTLFAKKNVEKLSIDADKTYPPGHSSEEVSIPLAVAERDALQPSSFLKMFRSLIVFMPEGCPCELVAF